MKHPDYWKVKAAVLAAQIAHHQADERLKAVLLAAGFDPNVPHDLNDAEETITPQQMGTA